MPISLPIVKARRRHERREAYEAVIGGPDHPQYIIALSPNAASTEANSRNRCVEGNGDWVGVYFLDDRWRWRLQYDFQEKDPGRLFLTRAISRDFAADTDILLGAQTLVFSEDGHILVELMNVASGSVDTCEMISSVELNWDDYPPFGDYSRLCHDQRVKLSL